MSLFFVHWVHLLAACIWIGGMITLAALVPALRKAGADRPLLQAAARAFARVSWVAMAVAIGTGLGQVVLKGLPWTYSRLHWKMTVVLLTVILAAVHQVTAKKSSPMARGILQGFLLLGGLAILAAAVAI